MPGEDLKSKLNAKAKAERESLEQRRTELREVTENLNREFPRLMNELIARVRAQLEGTDELSMETKEIRFSGEADFIASSLKVSFMGKERIAFRPEGFGAIKVVVPDGVKAPISEIVVTPSPSEPGRWILAVKGNSPQQRVELTDNALEDLLEHALA